MGTYEHIAIYSDLDLTRSFAISAEEKGRNDYFTLFLDFLLNRTIGWCVGDSSTETFKKFYPQFEHLDAMFYTDNWSSYSKVIPATRLTIKKQYTVGIEQNNSNI